MLWRPPEIRTSFCSAAYVWTFLITDVLIRKARRCSMQCGEYVRGSDVEFGHPVIFSFVGRAAVALIIDIKVQDIKICFRTW